ncbi:lipid A biosynthesis acyltransferase [Sphaerotilus sp.]|uniref:LpxL/LpxP family acyltransferase n=1 Tax=Sphaerotilus sp. TaxID=2093942 RepID=UPI0025F85B69|nr:lipid A biosynthesis acyltransferase [Sphaerotilus sp.]
MKSLLSRAGAHAVLSLLWLLHWLPMGAQHRLGLGLGTLLWTFGTSRRRIALRNLELCLPEKPVAEREAIARAHFGWLGRSFLERSVLWYASRERLNRLIHVEGDVKLAERSDRPVMWLVPHFLALDAVGIGLLLNQTRHAGSIYQAQSNPVFDAAVRRGRLRFGGVEVYARQEGARALMRAIKRGDAFFNLPDMDFGARDAAFVPFFGVPAATLLAPSRMAHLLNMTVQPVVGEMLPGGEGWRLRVLDPWPDFPTADAEADTARINRWIEAEVRKLPEQYLWVHKRFKTRPAGEAGLY